MSAGQHALDGEPGSPPDIRTDASGITFVMRPAGTRSDERLVLRCDTNGEVWMSIRPDITLDRSS
jgi:hypothetical protein